MTDRYAGVGDDLLGPASDAAAVTTSDTVDLPIASKRLFVGTGGTLKIDTVKGTTVTYANVPSGSYVNVRAARVWATGTSASDIVAEY